VKLTYDHPDCASIALFTARQLDVVLNTAPFDAFDASALTLVVRADGPPGAWYDPDNLEIEVSAGLYEYALRLVTALFTSSPSRTTNCLVESAKVYDDMLAAFVRHGRVGGDTYGHGWGPNHWVNDYRVLRFHAYVEDYVESHPELAVSITEMTPMFGHAVGYVADTLSRRLDHCVDIARYVFVFACLHELGHHVYAQDQSVRSKLFEIAGQVADRPAAVDPSEEVSAPLEEHYADAFAVIGAMMCKETSLSAEQLLFVRSLFETLVATLADTAILAQDLLHGRAAGGRRLNAFLRFHGLGLLQRDVVSILERWEVTWRRNGGVEEHWLTANPAFRKFDFFFYARLHAGWLEQVRADVAREGRVRSAGPPAV
jgi:hypothetical protein